MFITGNGGWPEDMFEIISYLYTITLHLACVTTCSPYKKHRLFRQVSVSSSTKPFEIFFEVLSYKMIKKKAFNLMKQLTNVINQISNLIKLVIR